MRKWQWGVLVLAVMMLMAAGCSCGQEETPATEGTGEEAGGEPDVVTTGGLIDLNKATVAELDEVRGISPKVARAIVAYREKHDGFKSVDELIDVDGIGDITFAKLKPLFTVGGEVAPAAEGDAPAEGEGEAEAAGGLVNVNTATLEELDAVKGIGIPTAKKIIAWREEHGPLRSVEDLKAAGIAAMTINNIKDLITFEGGSAPAAGAATTGAPAASSGGAKANLNTATAAQIKAACSGMPQTTADAIVAARQSAGGTFADWAQVDKVRGVGDATFDKLKAAFDLH